MNFLKNHSSNNNKKFYKKNEIFLILFVEILNVN